MTTTYPRKDRVAKTGSNLRGNPLLAHRSALATERRRLFEISAHELQQKTRTLFSKRDLKVAARLASDASKDFCQRSLAAHGDSLQIDRLKAVARGKLDRLLARELPQYRMLQKLRRDYARKHQTLARVASVAEHADEARIAWGAVVDGTNAESHEFTAPFPIHDASTVDDSHLIVRDESFVLPASGYLVNNVTFDHDEDTPAFIGFFGLIRAIPASSLASCGVSFTMPRQSRLTISAALRNLYNNIAFSVRDNVGFSHANLDVRLDLFIDVVRPNGVIHLPRTMVSSGIISHGSELGYSMPPLDTSAAYTVSGVTNTLPAGDSMWIVAGSEVHVDSELDDMHSHVDATVWWQLDKLTVQIID